MTKYKKFLIVLTFIPLSFECFCQDNDEKIEWKTLQTSRYSLKYPSFWELDQSGKQGTNFFIHSQLESENDKFAENVNLLIQDLSAYDIDLDQFIEITETQVKSMLPEGKIISSSRIEDGENSYHHIIYTGNYKDFKLIFEQLCWVVQDEAFILTFTSEENMYDSFIIIGQEILNSFHFH